MNYSLTWMPKVLQGAGLQVQLEPGWETRGRAEMWEAKGILCHHTAGPKEGDAPSIKIVRDGRPDLAGPLAQLVLARSGIFHVIAAGRCNHAGAGMWQGITDGNGHFIGIEAENTGYPADVWNTSDGKAPGPSNLGRVTKDGRQPYIMHPADPWPTEQMGAYVAGCAAILRHIGAQPIMCAGHKEYALPHGRKSDPSFDMVPFRAAIEAKMQSAH